MAVTEDQAAAFLLDHFRGEASAPTAVGHGEWSKAFRFSRAARDYVIRFSMLDEDFAKDQRAARYSAPGLPIPSIIETGEAFGGFYAISERVAGGYLDDVDGTQMRRLLPALFAALDAVRLVDVSPTRGFGIWGADGNAPHSSWRAYLKDIGNDRPTDRVHGWRDHLALSETGIGPFEDALRHFAVLVDGVPEERYLIHSDLLHFNVLVSGDRIAAVLDWGDAKYGDFLYDLAWFSFWSAWYRAWDGIDFVREAKRHFESIGLVVPHLAERVRCYELHIGLSGQAYCAFAGHWDDLKWTAQRTAAVAGKQDSETIQSRWRW